MATSRCRGRLVADPCIGVSDLLDCLIPFVEEVGEDAFHKTLEPPPQTGWKTAAAPTWLGRLSPLFKRFLNIAPNGVIPSKKHRVCLEKLQEKKNVASGRRTSAEHAERWDEWIRIGLSQMRGLKQSEVARARCLRKCDGDEQLAIEDVLSLLPEGDAIDQTEMSVVPAHPVEVPPEPVKAKEVSSASSAVSSAKASVDPTSIFQAVLDGQSMETLSEVKAARSPVARKGKDFRSNAGTMDVSYSGYLSSLLQSGVVDDKDAELLVACKTQAPINKGYKSQLQRANLVLKDSKAAAEKGQEKGETKSTTGGGNTKKKTGGTKTVKKTGVKDKNEGKAETKKKTDSVKEKPVAVSKKKGDDLDCKQDKKKQKQSLSDGTPKGEEQPQEGLEPSEVPNGFDKNVSRSTNRKRYTSRHWHQAYDKAINEGVEPGEAKEFQES